MIKVLIGDILKSNAQTLVNTVNCVGVMGKGIAKEFKMAYPGLYKQYKQKCEKGEIKPGVPSLYTDLKGVKIINFPTKDDWRNNANINDIIKGLDIFVDNYKKWGIKSIAFPPLGCGNGGLEWDYVGPIMYNKLKDLDVDIEIYAPYGTEKHQLTKEFLSQNINVDEIIRRKIRSKLRPEWAPILKVIKNLSEEQYANPVGRTTFQKICFASDQLDIVDFNFKRSSYGPFSKKVKPTLATLANNNIIREERKGKMIALKLGTNYDSFIKNNENEVNENYDKIQKITDLFQRIKNTEQAEEVATVLWIERELKKSNEFVTDTRVIEEVIKWKKDWNNKKKMNHIYNAIITLNMLEWTNIIIENNAVINYINKSN